jgi:hypothetical protein
MNRMNLALSLVATLTLHSASQAATVIVSPTNMNGWEFFASDASDASPSDNGIVTGAGALVLGPAVPPAGTGSAQLTVVEGGDSSQLRTSAYGGTLLSSVSQLTYSTYVTTSATGDQAPYMQLRLDYDGNGSLDDILHFEPEYQSGYTGNVPDQGALTNLTWQSWDALAGGWWSVFNTLGTGAAGSNVLPLSSFVTANPTATIIASNGLRFVTGFGHGSWDAFNGNVDEFTIATGAGSTTFDFEPIAIPEPATIAMLGITSAGLGFFMVRRRRRA